MTSTQLFPEVLDATTIGARFTAGIFLPIGVEGNKGASGSAAIGAIQKINTPAECVGAFGTEAEATLTPLVRWLLDNGAAPVFAVASHSGVGSITLAARQAVWSQLESRRDIRIRMTDSLVNSDHVALAQSCGYANLMSNKQFAFVGVAKFTDKATLIADAAAISAVGVDYASRCVMVGPGVYDASGQLLSGGYAAASVAAAVAKNNDPSDDLDMTKLPFLTAIETDGQANPAFRESVVTGVLHNDFEDLLQAGVSPLCNHRDGGVAISHLRTAYIGDSGTYDALMTRLIADQVFVVIRAYCEDFAYLRKGNTPTNRGLLQASIDDILNSLAAWVQPVDLGDGTVGYGVTVVPSPDKRQMIIDFQGEVVRGVQTILVNGHLVIPV